MSTATEVTDRKPEDSKDQDLTIIIKSMRGTKTFTFGKITKVVEVIAVAVREFGFAPDDKFDLVFPDKPGEPLDHNRTLVSYHIKDGTELLLTSIGGGV